MRLLVTGGAGYIGSHTSEALINAGHEVVVFDNLSTGFRDAVPWRADFVEGDVRESKPLEDVLERYRIEAVIHFAAKLVVPESLDKPLEYYENNTVGVLNLAQACIKKNINRVVFSSTAAVYGDVVMQGLIDENADTQPINPYGTSKLMSEKVLRDCEAPFGLRSVCLRYFNVAGAASNGRNGQRTANATHLIKVASQAAVGKRSCVGIFGTDYSTPDGTGVRDYIHVEDLADLHVLALEYLNQGGRSDIFNCGYSHGSSVREVIHAVKVVSGIDFKVEECPRRPGDASKLVANSNKIRSTFNWSPKRDDLMAICKSAFEWEKTLLESRESINHIESPVAAHSSGR